MTDTTATINSKGLDGTGITEEMAGELFHKVGSHMMAIVDIQVVDKHGPNLKGKRKVVFTIDSIEPATDENVAEHLRELTRTMHYNRQLITHGPTLDAGEERTVDDVLAAGKKHEPHPFLSSTLSIEDDGVCDVCGQREGAAVHADRDALEDPFAVTEADLDAAEDEEGQGDDETGEGEEPEEPDAEDLDYGDEPAEEA